MRKLRLSLPAVALLAAALNGCASEIPTASPNAPSATGPSFGVMHGSGNRDGTSTTGATENTNATDSMAAAVAGVMYGSGN